MIRGPGREISEQAQRVNSCGYKARHHVIILAHAHMKLTPSLTMEDVTGYRSHNYIIKLQWIYVCCCKRVDFDVMAH